MFWIRKERKRIQMFKNVSALYDSKIRKTPYEFLDKVSRTLHERAIRAILASVF